MVGGVAGVILLSPLPCGSCSGRVEVGEDVGREEREEREEMEGGKMKEKDL